MEGEKMVGREGRKNEEERKRWKREQGTAEDW